MSNKEHAASWHHKTITPARVVHSTAGSESPLSAG